LYRVQALEVVQGSRGRRGAATEEEKAAGSDDEHGEAYEQSNAKPRVHMSSIGKQGVPLYV
jgi:hypothetical protein